MMPVSEPWLIFIEKKNRTKLKYMCSHYNISRVQTASPNDILIHYSASSAPEQNADRRIDLFSAPCITYKWMHMHATLDEDRT